VNREIYEVAITRPNNISIAHMRRYIDTAVRYFMKGSDLSSWKISEADVKVKRQRPDESMWIEPDVRSPKNHHLLYILLNNGRTVLGRFETLKADLINKVSYHTWVDINGVQIPTDQIKGWMRVDK
jgi:hypothetical protein